MTKTTKKTKSTVKKSTPKPTTSKYILIRKSKIHNRGVFAKKNIPKGAKVIQYAGEIVTKKEGDRRSEVMIEHGKKDKNNGFVYIFELNKKYDIDGSVEWNTAKWINHKDTCWLFLR